MRTFLEGRFENSAFCLLSPDGQDWLSRAGRGPEMVLGRSPTSSIARLNQVATVYGSTAPRNQALVPDFHSVRQALNVASADQRVLVVVHGAATELNPLRESLRQVSNDDRIIGRFHFDFDSLTDWKKNVAGMTLQSGIAIIKSGEFGLKGTVIAELPLAANREAVIETLLRANRTFVATTEKKIYSDHVSKGRQQGVYFEGAVPYGEDRDGDGQIDHGGRLPGFGSGSGGRSRSRSTGRRSMRP